RAAADSPPGRDRPGECDGATMKKWLRRILSAVALIALTVGIVFEMETHVARGWLCGEACYDGRPTSYWRARCDEWIDRFDSVQAAAKHRPSNITLPVLDDDEIVGGLSNPVLKRRQTWWTRLKEFVHPGDDDWQQDWPPQVLFGFPGSEEVLRELSADVRYRP